jgi:hypothetical protein
VDEAFAGRLRSGRPQSAAGTQHRQPAPRWRGPSPLGVSPPGPRRNSWSGPGTCAAATQILLLVPRRRLRAPYCLETKATRDRMARAQPADNPRVVVHTYQQPPQPYNHGPAPHPPHHAYQHHQEVQIVPPPLPPPHPQQQNIHHPNHPKPQSKKTSPISRIVESFT